MKPILIDNQLLLTDSIHVKEVDLPYLDTPLHFHNAYEMVWIRQGSGHRIVGDHIEKFTHDDLILMGPNLPHVWYNEKDYYLKESTQRVLATVIYFKPEWLTDVMLNSAELTKLRDLLHNLKRGLKIDGVDKEKIIKHVTKLPQSSSLKRIIRILNILNILSKSTDYTCLSSAGYVNAYHQRDVEKINRIYQYIMMHYTDKIKLEDAAQIANMTPTAFCKYFKSRTQKTFSNFVNEVRIGYACKLLCIEELNISEICYQAGFYNPTNFNKNFRLFKKMSPSDFRNSLKL